MEKTFNYQKRKKKFRKGGKMTEQKVRHIIKSALEPVMERKFFDTALNITMDNNFSVAPTQLSLMAQGVGQSERIGNNVNIESIFLRFYVTQALVTGTLCRTVVLQWNEDSSQHSPNWNDILEYFTAVPQDILSPQRISQRSRFRILFDKSYYIVLGDSTQEHLVEIYIDKGYNKTIEFNDSSLSGNNKIYMLNICNVASANAPLLTGYSRIRFTDA